MPGFSGVGPDELAVHVAVTQPPLPNPGQSVHWTAAMRLIAIDQERSIRSASPACARR